MSSSGLDTYNEHSSLNPANQDEPVSKITYEVSIDKYEIYSQHEIIEEAEEAFNNVINGLAEFHEVDLFEFESKTSAGKTLKHATADVCFLQLKQKISEYSSLDNNFAWSLLKIKN